MYNRGNKISKFLNLHHQLKGGRGGGGGVGCRPFFLVSAPLVMASMLGDKGKNSIVEETA